MDNEIAPGTLIPVEGYAVQLPLSDETCRGQIAKNLLGCWPEAVRRKKLTVIANGLSAREVDLRKIEGDTLALNGALRLFTDQGLAPTYWACCDPQSCVADFLTEDPPAETIYLVASKCHPSVFEKLRGRDVRIWHVRDQPVPGKLRIALATSITLSATWLMYSLGYTDFEYWGWDACFVAGRHHAAEGVSGAGEVLYMNYGGRVVFPPRTWWERLLRRKNKPAEVLGGRNFETTRSWAMEAQWAQQFFQHAQYFDLRVVVHGSGMIEEARRVLVADGRLE